MKALRTHQLRWSVTVTRKYNPPRKIVVFGRTPAEALARRRIFCPGSMGDLGCQII
jgi:hypothetical protein